MTTREFLRLIRQVRDQFDWTLRADTGHHAERRATPRFRLEARPVTRPEITLDPIRALVYARAGVVPDTWTEAAVVLGMRPADANALAAAASNRTWTQREGKRMPVIDLLAIREQLLEAVGLVAVGIPEPRIQERSDFSHPRPTPR